MHHLTPFQILLLMMAILGLILPLVASTLWLMAWLVGKVAQFHLPFAPFAWTAVGLLAIIYLGMAYGYVWGRWKLKVSNVAYEHADIPTAFDGYKVVHISDLHLNSFDSNPEELARIVRCINDRQPDLICFTGDLVTHSPQEILPHASTLQQLKAKDGILSVMGNHDFLIYGRHADSCAQATQVQQVAALERELLGWTLLRNEHVVLRRGNDSICILGVDNQHGSGQGFQTIAKGDLKAAAEGSSGFRILLSHDPSHWSHEVLTQTDIPLTLSGHTHNGQIELLGWSAASLTFRETAGRYDRDGQTLYVNAGLGNVVPVRLGANPEITLITLHTPTP